MTKAMLLQRASPVQPYQHPWSPTTSGLPSWWLPRVFDRGI